MPRRRLAARHLLPTSEPQVPRGRATRIASLSQRGDDLLAAPHRPHAGVRRARPAPRRPRPPGAPPRAPDDSRTPRHPPARPAPRSAALSWARAWHRATTLHVGASRRGLRPRAHNPDPCHSHRASTTKPPHNDAGPSCGHGAPPAPKARTSPAKVATLKAPSSSPPAPASAAAACSTPDTTCAAGALSTARDLVQNGAKGQHCYLLRHKSAC